MPTPPYGRATAPWVRFCHILHSTHHSARSRRTRAVSDSTASSGRNSASSRSPALVLGCPFLSFSSTFRSRHQSLYLSSMAGYSNPEIQICKSAKIHPEALSKVFICPTFDHARRLKAPFVLPPRPGRRTHCAGTGGVATLPRAVPRNVPRPPQLSGERRGAASGSFGESPTSCTAYRGEFSAPKAFVPHARSHRSPKH